MNNIKGNGLNGVKPEVKQGIKLEEEEEIGNQFRDTRLNFFDKSKRGKSHPTSLIDKMKPRQTIIESAAQQKTKEYFNFLSSKKKKRNRSRVKRYKSLPRKRATFESTLSNKFHQDTVIEESLNNYTNTKNFTSVHQFSSELGKSSNHFKVNVANHKIVNKKKFNFFKSIGKKKKGDTETLQTELARQFFNSIEHYNEETLKNNLRENSIIFAKQKVKEFKEKIVTKPTLKSLNSSFLSSNMFSNASNSSKLANVKAKLKDDDLKKTTEEIFSKIINNQVGILEGNSTVYIKNLIYTIEKLANSNSILQPIFKMFNESAPDVFLLTSEKRLKSIKSSINKVLSWTKVLELTTFISAKFSVGGVGGLFGRKKKKKSKKKKLFLNPGVKPNIFLGQTVQDALYVLTQSMDKIGEIKMKFEKMLKENIAKYKAKIKELQETNNNQTESFALYLKRIEGNFKHKYGRMQQDLKGREQKNYELKKECFMMKEAVNRLQSVQGESRANQLSMVNLQLSSRISELENEVLRRKTENLKLNGKMDFLKVELDLAQREIDAKKTEINTVQLQFKEFEKNQVKIHNFKKKNLDPKMIKICEIFRLMSTQEKKKFGLMSFTQQADVMIKRIKEFTKEVLNVITNKDKDKIQLLTMSLETIIERKIK